MDSLMLGIGVGFDTRGANHIPVNQPFSDSVDNFTIPDTREGWVTSLALLLNSYFLTDKN